MLVYTIGDILGLAFLILAFLFVGWFHLMDWLDKKSWWKRLRGRST